MTKNQLVLELMRLRKKNRWTQSDLAQRIDVSLRTVWRWENYESVPSKLARRALKGLGIKP